ncbi:DNA replication complex GINS protein PSF1-like isoform X2 [Ostrea edulis]|uniref:DNA replication complex GINS protein PSF1-like isoform X2 n=1 Tax=Ostrea edulis TaxID=37623 RepID=UPI002095EB9F|nr:DNA replication complex GINS protein PSF1-like isoform X2 [Ostrea edulis]
MLAEKALELLRELQRTLDGSLPPYNEDAIRLILEEMKALFEQNQKDVSATVAGENGLFSGVQLRHSALERNKRCLLAYLYNRLEHMKKMRWEFGSVLPPEVKFNMCEPEVRCLMDHGEFETQDGNILLLKKNSQHFMLRSECEHLIRQGILEHIVH